ncbi:MAG: TolC family protein [Armatimonadota bacterium]|nr:MAG: TolC family protein [Armatimonadota bacterium]
MTTRCVAAIGLLALVVLASGPGVPAGAEEPAGRGVIPKTLSLERAIAIAIQYNPQVEVSRQGTKAAAGQVTQAISRLLPRVDVSARRVTPVDLPPFSFQSTDSTWETEFSLSQPLYTGGAIPKGVEAAEGYRAGSEGAYRRTRQEIAFAVRQGYYGVLTAEQGVKVAHEALSSAKEHLRVARLRYEAGVAPQFDVLAAEARVARVEQGAISAVAGRDIAWAGLSTVLGVPIPEDTQLTTPRPVTIEEADPEALRLEALANRPDLLATKSGTAAALAVLEVTRAARKPTITAGLSYTLREQTTIEGELFGAPGQEIVVSQNSGYLVLAANYSLFNGGQVEGEIRTAEAQHKQAEKGAESLEQRIELEVKSAYLLVEAAKAQVEAAQKEVAQAQEAHRIATLRYHEGVGTSVEILDAEANLEGAKTRLNEAIFGLNLAVAELDLAVGRDWPELMPGEGGTEAAREQ